MKPVFFIIPCVFTALAGSLAYSQEVPSGLEERPYSVYVEDKLDDADIHYKGGFRIYTGASYAGRNIWVTTDDASYNDRSFEIRGAESVHVENMTLMDGRSPCIMSVSDTSNRSTLTNLHIIAKNDKEPTGTSRIVAAMSIHNAEVEFNGYKLTNADPDNILLQSGMEIYNNSIVSGRGYEYVMLNANRSEPTRAFFMRGSNSSVNLSGCRFTGQSDAYNQSLIEYSGTGNEVTLTDSVIDLHAVYGIRTQSGSNRFTMKGGSFSVGENGRLAQSLGAGTVLDVWFEGVSDISGRMDGSSNGELNVALMSTRWNIGDKASYVTSISLDSMAALGFSTLTGPLNFRELNALSVALESGTCLFLDREADEYSAGDIIKLFKGVVNWENDGALLLTSDHYALEYIDLQNGSFELTGNIVSQIPEPAGATLALFGLGVLLLRRRK